MAHAPSDPMRRLIAVAISGVLTLIGVGLMIFGLLTAFVLSQVFESHAFLIGIVVLVAGAVMTAIFGVVTATLVIQWRRSRAERSNRP